MPKIKKLPSNGLSGDALDARLNISKLRSPEGLKAATGWFLNLIASSSSHLDKEVRKLANAPNILALLLSSSHQLLAAVQKTLLQCPTSAELYPTSLHAVVLAALSEYLNTIEPTGDVASNYRTNCGSIPSLHQALIAIGEYQKATPLDPLLDETPNVPDVRRGKKKQSQKQRLRDAQAEQQLAFSAATFECIGRDPPESPEAAASIEKDLVEGLKTILEYLILDVFASPSMTKRIRSDVLKTIEAPERDLLAVSDMSLPKTIEDASPPQGDVPKDDEYPMLAPPKAKQVFDSPEGFGDWGIFMAGEAIKHLREFQRGDKHIFSIVQKKIKELSTGFFSADNQKQLVGVDKGVQIFEAKTTGDLRIVYRIDLQSDETLQVDQQVIRIYGIYTHAKMDHRLWSRVARCIPRNDPEYRRRCQFRSKPIVRGANANNVTPPMQWKHEDYAIQVNNEIHQYSEDEFLQLHKILSLEKFIPFSGALLRTIMADIDANHEFSVSPTEMRIIHHPGSSFVIGRSGTGKTTTMLFKLLGIQLASRRQQAPGAHKIRQIFLTQSHVLAHRVSEYYSQLVHAAEYSGTSAPGAGGEELDLFELDEEADERPDLPPRYSELKDDHFPLFLTFDQLRRMLENDLGISFTRKAVLRRRRETQKLSTQGSLESEALLGPIESMFLSSNDSESVTASKSSFVSFNVFIRDFWPHFDQKLVKGFDPALIFSEIMGVIMGHEATLASDCGYLDQFAYADLSTRAHSSFAQQRDRVYAIFERYLKLKHSNLMHDSPDRTHAILRAFNGTSANPIDFLYVDEVQDLLTIDTKLLRQLCPNPRGYFWGGDTAQTISVGSSFRFEDLKALMWRDEEHHPQVVGKLRPPLHHSHFELLINYRSHGGIVNCAASIVELISSLFPYSIDKLQKESAIVAGPKPCVFRSDVVHFEEFLAAGRGSRLEFGARQVIITRDDRARTNLRRILGDAGLILTLMESKGLEFDDVLLYDFWGSSPATSAQWRVVNSEAKDAGVRQRVIESELKRLYVAVTRARHHCWLWDWSDTALPMLEYWASKDLIKIMGKDDQIPQLSTMSTPEEWNQAGRVLFGRRLFTQAASCFDKAHRQHDREVSIAYQLREDARAVNIQDRKLHQKRIRLFREAARAFQSCTESSTSDSDRHNCYRHAGECFLKAEDFEFAAKSFKAAKEFTEAALLFRKIGDFDEAIDIVKPYTGEESLVDPSVKDEIIKVAKLEYARKHDFKRVAHLFDHDMDEQLDYLEDFGLEDARTVLLESIGDYNAAGTLHLKEGQLHRAVECFLKSTDQETRRRAIPCTLDGIRMIAFGGDFDDDARRLLAMLDNVSQDNLSSGEAAELAIFRAIASKDRSQLQSLAWLHRMNPVHQALCLNQVLRLPSPPIQTLPLADLVNELGHRARYFSLITQMLRSPSLCRDEKIMSILGITPTFTADGVRIHDQYSIRRISYFGGVYRRSGVNVAEEEAYFSLSESTLNNLFRKQLEHTIRDSIERLHSALLGLKTLRPCYQMATHKNCNRLECDRDHMALTLPDYPTTIVRVHLAIVWAMHSLWSLSDHQGITPLRHEVRRVWTERVFRTFQPLPRRLTNPTEHRNLPETREATPVLQGWLADMILESNPACPLAQKTLSNALVWIVMSQILHDGHTPQYLPRASGFLALHPELVRPNSTTSVIEDLLVGISRQGPEQHRLLRGCLAVRYIMQRGLMVDIHALVQYLEFMALETISTWRQNYNPGFHGLTLPLSWMRRFILGPDRSRSQNYSVQLLSGSCIDILRLLVSPIASHFLLDERPLGSALLPRQLLISRICRMLVLSKLTFGHFSQIVRILMKLSVVGYHGASGVRDLVMTAISSTLRKSNAALSFLYAKYANAQSWKDMTHALWDSAWNDNDVIITLVEESRGKAPLRPPRSVKVITFSSRADIEAQLEVVRTVATLPNPSVTTDSHEPDEPIEEPANAEFDLVNAGVQGGDIDDMNEIEVLTSRTLEEPPSEGEIKAAALIQKWYRRTMRNRRSKKDPLLLLAVNNCGKSLPHVSKELVGNYSRFIAVARGPFPHALTALYRLDLLAGHVKAGFKKRITKVQHSELEQVQQGMTNVNFILKQVQLVKKMLDPLEDVFRAGNLASLQTMTQKIADLVNTAKEKLKLGTTTQLTQLDEDLAIAFKGIIRRKAVPIEASKPELNTDDLDGYDDF